MIVPEYVTPIVGYRAWRQLEGPLLTSLNVGCETWPPGEPMTARCVRISPEILGIAPLPEHQAPDEHCGCGIYALKTPAINHLYRTDPWPSPLVYGEVYLWGKVVEHEHGWRAQYAYPKSLIFLWTRWSEVTGLEALTAYGANIYHMSKPKKADLLWTKQNGYTELGKTLLVSAKRKPIREASPLGWLSCNPNSRAPVSTQTNRLRRLLKLSLDL